MMTTLNTLMNELMNGVATFGSWLWNDATTAQVILVLVGARFLADLDRTLGTFAYRLRRADLGKQLRKAWQRI